MIRAISKFSTLLFAEAGKGTPSKSFYQTLTAAHQIKAPVDVLLCGKHAKEAGERLKSTATGINKILLACDPALDNFQSERYQQLLLRLIKNNSYKFITVGSGSLGKDILPRVAAHFDSQPVTDIVKIVSSSQFVRPIYASNANQLVESSDPIKFLSFRPASFQPAKGTSTSEFVDCSTEPKSIKARHVKFEVIESDKPQLSTARIVVSGGRGVKSKQNFKLIEELANSIGQAAVGASRAAVDSGFCSNDMQVGQTGKVVAPQLYIAVGISGAVQHLAGMKDSKVIVAINKDPEASIFEVANYGLVADLFSAVPELSQKIKAGK